MGSGWLSTGCSGERGAASCRHCATAEIALWASYLRAPSEEGSRLERRLPAGRGAGREQLLEDCTLLVGQRWAKARVNECGAPRRGGAIDVGACGEQPLDAAHLAEACSDLQRAGDTQSSADCQQAVSQRALGANGRGSGRCGDVCEPPPHVTISIVTPCGSAESTWRLKR